MRVSDTHCEHGTYIGGPCGPDYLCGYCEDGVTVAEMREARDQARVRQGVQLRDAIDGLRAAPGPFNAGAATYLVRWVTDEVARLRLDDALLARVLAY